MPILQHSTNLTEHLTIIESDLTLLVVLLENVNSMEDYARAQLEHFAARIKAKVDVCFEICYEEEIHQDSKPLARRLNS